MKPSFLKSGIQRIIKKISQVKISFYINLRFKKHKKQISLPFLHCKGSKTNIDISLAFRGDVGTPEESHEDLYLKGTDLNTGDEVNFYKSGVNNKNGERIIWSLQVFENSSVFLVGNRRGKNYLNTGEGFKCKDQTLVIKKATSVQGGYWEKPISEVNFDFRECEETLGRKECEIKIENFKNENLSTFEDITESESKAFYLKGHYSNTGEEVNFDEELDMGSNKQKLWQLKVFKEKGTTQLARLSGGYAAREEDNDEPICESNMFEITKGTYGREDSWEKSISEVSFDLLNCNGTLGKEICDIKIA